MGIVPDFELSLCEPLDGVATMLELGNKHTEGQEHPFKIYFESIGIKHTSIDLNGEDRALVMDLRTPLNLGKFDMVTNFGTSEHVSEQEPVWRNIVEATRTILISATPCPGLWPGHGMWYPHPDFYRELARLNGFAIERELVHYREPNLYSNCVRLRRVNDVEFVMPDISLIHHEADWDMFTPKLA